MSEDLRLAAGGIGWNYLASGTILVAQVLYTATTARLVSPTEFGAYAAAQALFTLVGYFGLATLGSALIRHERGGRHAVGTAFAISIAAGGAASLLVLVAAGPWADLWDVPASRDVARAFSLVVFVTAFSVIPLALLRKGLEYRRAALVESIAQIAGMGVGVAFAFELRNPTALVLGQAAGALLAAGISLIFARRQLALAFSRTEARALLSFSGHVSAQSLTYYGIYTAPSLVISRLFGSTALGVFSRANALVTLPTTHLWMGVTKVLYPLIARARDDGQRLRALIEATLITTTGVVWPLFAAVAGAAPLVVAILLGSDFTEVKELLPPILVFGALNFAYVVAGNPLEVLGHQAVIWRYQLAWVALLATALVAAVVADASLTALLWLVALAQCMIHGLKLRATQRLGLIRLGPVLRGYAASICVSALFFAVAFATANAVDGHGSLLWQAVLEVLAVGAVTCLTVAAPLASPFQQAVRSGIGTMRTRGAADGAP